MSEDSKDLIQRLMTIRSNIKKACDNVGRSPEEILLLAVSKFQPLEKIKTLYEQGQRHFGESYLNEALIKQASLSNEKEISWHYIGRIQSKKINKLLQNFSLIESVGSLDTLKEIAIRAERLGLRARVLLQVNIGDEPTKEGFLPEVLTELSKEVYRLNGIQLEGLMCLPPLTDDEKLKRNYFRKMKSLFDEFRKNLSDEQVSSFKELSMGTSHDYELAVEEGATLIRVGSSLFGERPSDPMQPN